MATFQAQIEGLTGLTIGTAPTTGEVTQFINDGVIEVSNRIVQLKPDEASDYLRESSEQTDNGFNPGSTRIFTVLRETGTNNDWRACARISPDLQSRVTDKNSIYYASKYSPVYMVTQNRNVHVFPAPENPSSGGAADNKFKVLYVNNTPENGSGGALVYSNSNIKWFPEDKVYLVVLYAAIKSLGNALADLEVDPVMNLPAIPPSITLNTRTVSLPTIGSITPFAGVADIIDANVDFTGLPTFPTYIQPTINLSAPPTIADLSITAVAPTPPALSDNSVDFATLVRSKEPTLALTVKPVPQDIGDFTWDDTIDFSGSLPVPTAPTQMISRVNTSGLTNPTFTMPALPSLNYTDVGTWINTEEDSEMAAARLQEIQTKIQQHTDEVQAEVARWQNDSSILQKDLQIAMQDSQSSGQEYEIAINKYAGEVQAYTAEVNKLIQKHVTEQSVRVQGYQAKVSTKLQLHLQEINAYNIEVQDKLNIYNKELAIYQSEIQKVSQDSTIGTQDDQNKIAKYTQELAQYQTDMSKEVQNYTNSMTKDVQLWQTERTTDLSKYQADIQNETARVSTGGQEYASKMEKALQQYNAETGYDVAKHQAILQARVQEFQNGLAKVTSDFQNELQKYNVEVQAITSDNQSKIGKYNAEVQSYSAEAGSVIQDFNSKLQRYNLNYGWMQSRQGELKQQYDTAFQIMAPRAEQPRE